MDWEKVNINKHGIESFAKKNNNEIIGYNGILKGDCVVYNEEKYIVVMVSRLGDFGLSKTGKLPYSIRVSPLDCVKTF